MGNKLSRSLTPRRDSPYQSKEGKQEITNARLVHPMENRAKAGWGLQISDADLKRLVNGYLPEDMDEKWMCSADELDQQGNIVVHFCRSWTGREQVALKVSITQDDKRDEMNCDSSATSGAEITEISWKACQGVTEMEAKKLAVDVCRGILGCELDAEYKAPCQVLNANA